MLIVIIVVMVYNRFTVMNIESGLELALGEQLRAIRLRANLDQRQLAERAGVALNAVKNLENGKGSTLHSLIQVLKVLDRTDWLGALAPAVSISPVQMLKTRAPRQRASRPRTKTGTV